MNKFYKALTFFIEIIFPLLLMIVGMLLLWLVDWKIAIGIFLSQWGYECEKYFKLKRNDPLNKLYEFVEKKKRKV